MAFSAVLENVFPPFPADIVIALGAFQSHQNVTTPWKVFVVTWVFNVLGAGIVYGVSRRYGRAFFSGRIGRRLLTPDGIARLERGYLRFGIVGIFFARLLPAFRSFVPPFIGLIELPPIRAFIPVAAASAIWYGALIGGISKLAAEWDRVEGLLVQVNRSLGVVSLLAALGIALVLLRRERHRKRREELGLVRAFLILARAEKTLPDDELRLIERHLLSRWGVTEDVLHAEAGLIFGHPDEEREPPSREERVETASRLWRLAIADGVLSRHETRLMHRANRLLDLESGDSEEARRRALER